MKKLYTSYYARSGNHPDAIAISAKAPQFYRGKFYSPLAPTWDLLRAYKSGEIDERGYTEWYLRLLIKDRKLTPEKVVDDLKDGSIMLCYEGPGKFCHRHIVAEWLETAGVTVTEITPETPQKPVDDLLQF
ncbi:MAG: hypothetical protein E4H14_06820 [Candidatus Thorarchaeota archaeon]|nr:MAG: hypothetical protein E4H14_06820 [Candidatus Thorarchaeota archaeon]